MGVLGVVGCALAPGVLADATYFDWTKLTPSEKLTWTPCYSSFECSRLIVPIDYQSPDAGSAAIAVTRYPANVSSQSEYRGPILLNPGGPGASGVDYVVQSGQSLSLMLGNDFDIVGFDPRGVSYSTPIVSFFRTQAERAQWMPATTAVVYPVNSSDVALGEAWAQYQVLGTLANDRNDHYEYMTTDNTARDMLLITEAFGWEKLQYWGASYGSVLGSTFAVLFPDKVGRIVIDGVLDMEAWYHSNLTVDMLDTDAVLQTFFEVCAAAGPDGCAFYAPSAAQISANLDQLIASIREQPFPVVTPNSYGVFDYTLLKNFLFDSLYDPYQLFPFLGQGLADLAKGNATTIWASMMDPIFECDCAADQPEFHDNWYDSAAAILCGDGLPHDETLEELRQFYAETERVSPFFGDIFAASVQVLCSGWKLNRTERFTGPFGAKNTSFPLLVIGNSLDPVTPLVNAIKTARDFPGSGLLTVDGPGHTSSAVPSTCVNNYLRQYFRDGTLPANGTICSPDQTIFPSATGNVTQARNVPSPRNFASRAPRSLRRVHEFFRGM